MNNIITEKQMFNIGDNVLYCDKPNYRPEYQKFNLKGQVVQVKGHNIYYRYQIKNLCGKKKNKVWRWLSDIKTP